MSVRDGSRNPPSPTDGVLLPGGVGDDIAGDSVVAGAAVATDESVGCDGDGLGAGLVAGLGAGKPMPLVPAAATTAAFVGGLAAEESLLLLAASAFAAAPDANVLTGAFGAACAGLSAADGFVAAIESLPEAGVSV